MLQTAGLKVHATTGSGDGMVDDESDIKSYINIILILTKEKNQSGNEAGCTLEYFA